MRRIFRLISVLKTPSKYYILFFFSLASSFPTLAQLITTEKGIASHYGNEFQGKPTASGELYDNQSFTAAHKSLPFGTQVQVQNMENEKTVVVRINDRGPFVEGRIIDLSIAAAKILDMIEPGTVPVEIRVVQFDTVHKATIETHFSEDSSTADHVEPVPVEENEMVEVATPDATLSPDTLTTQELSPSTKTSFVDTSAHPIGHIYDTEGEDVKPWGYGVQVSATHSYENAVHYAEILQQQGFSPTFIEANLVGQEKYYRIIIGNFATRALAEGEQARLLGKGLNGFIKKHIAHP